MKLLSLRAKGFKGIKKGLGVDEIFIDFSNLNGLTAFAGDNGKAKTTTMELMHPFRHMPSHPGAMQNNVYLRDSVKEFIFEMRGDHYRTLLKLDCGGRSEAFIYKNHSESAMNDGKNTTYDAEIFKLFGSQELFFVSEFTAQKGKFTKSMDDMRTSEAKDLYAEALGLHVYQEYEKTAKGCIGILLEKKDVVEGNIKNLSELLLDYVSQQEGINLLIGSEASRTDLLNSAAARQFEISEEILDEKEVIIKNKSLTEKKDDLTKQVETIDTEINGLKKEIHDKGNETQTIVAGLEVKLLDIEDLLKSKDDILNASNTRKELEETKETFEKSMTGYSEKLPAAIQKILDIEKNISELKLNIQKLGNDPEEKRLSSEISEKESRVKNAEKTIAENIKESESKIAIEKSEIRRLKSLVESLECNIAPSQGNLNSINGKIRNCISSLKLKKGIDPDCKSTTCEFIKDSILAKEKLPEYEKEKAVIDKKILEENRSIEEKINSICSEIIQAEKRCSDSNDSRLFVNTVLYETIDDIRPVLDKLKSDLEKYWAYASGKKASFEKSIDQLGLHKKEELKEKEEIETTIKHYKDELETIAVSIQKTIELSSKKDQIAGWEIQKKSIENEAATAMESHEKIKRDIFSRIDAKEFKKRDLYNSANEIHIDTAAGSRKELLEKELTSVNEKIQTLQTELLSIKASIAGIQKQLESKEETEKTLKERQGLLDRINLDLTQFEYIKVGCGKKGLQALEIDFAAPRIAGYANQILSSNFGPQYTVKYNTLDADGKEVLDIMVIDDKGDEELLHQHSGGERVWILQALTEGLNMLSCEKSGSKIDTILRDEADGALSTRNAIQFVGLYRSLLEITGKQQCFYISHKAEAVALADNVLTFETGGITIN